MDKEHVEAELLLFAIAYYFLRTPTASSPPPPSPFRGTKIEDQPLPTLVAHRKLRELANTHAKGQDSPTLALTTMQVLYRNHTFEDKRQPDRQLSSTHLTQRQRAWRLLDAGHAGTPETPLVHLILGRLGMGH